jgi:selenocysteine-specific elongation factor
VAAALERAAARARPRAALPSRARRGAAEERIADPGTQAVLHVDRAFTITGAGTVVTGTLWSGRIARGQRLRLLPSGRVVRVRGVQVHDTPVEAAQAGQRVAVNLTGVERRAVAPGDVLAGERAPVRLAYRIEAELELEEPLADRERVQLHHGTRDVPARAVHREGRRWQLRAQRPLIAAAGDRFVLRRISPPGTLGGGVILAPGRRREPAERERERAAARTHEQAEPAGAGAALEPEALALEQRLRAAGAQPPSEQELGDQARYLPALRAAGRAVRIGRSLYAHPEALQDVRLTVERLIAAEGAVTLARLRDELQTSRKYAQALLEHLDAARVTRRLPDDSRVLRRRALASRAQREP